MGDKRMKHLTQKEIEDVLGPPPFKTWGTFLLASLFAMAVLYFLVELGFGSNKGGVGFIALIILGFGCLVVPIALFFGLLDAFCMRKPYEYNFRRLANGEIQPDFFMPKKTLGGHFLFVDRSLGRLFTSHSNYQDGYPLHSLYQMTCGFEGKRHFMIFRFRSGDNPELHITARTQKDANQQVIRLQNFLGWN